MIPPRTLNTAELRLTNSIDSFTFSKKVSSIGSNTAPKDSAVSLNLSLTIFSCTANVLVACSACLPILLLSSPKAFSTALVLGKVVSKVIPISLNALAFP